MLRPDRGIERVYLHRAPVDMRKQIDGLAILARDVIQQDPLQGAMFAFINARRNKLTHEYSADIARLASILGRDLKEWREPRVGVASPLDY